MKKTMILMAMLLAMTSSAMADNKLTVSDVTIKAGETAEVTFSMENDFTVKAYNFVVVLPQGIEPYYDEEEDDYAAELSGRHASKHSLTVLPSGEFENGWLLGVASSAPKQSLKDNSGEILTLTLIAGADVASGTYPCSLKNIWFAESGDAGVAVEDVNFNIVVEGEAVETTPYYLVGNFTNWQLDETLNLKANQAATGEYMITLDFAANSEFKVIEVGGESWIWYPGGSNCTINDAGNYTIYFRPGYNGNDDWFEGCIYVLYNGPATGINAVTTTAENAVIYNLKGQRVMNAQKGLYIQNGKKVVK